MYDPDSTIVALSSAAGSSATSVVRVSGRRVAELLERFTRQQLRGGIVLRVAWRLEPQLDVPCWIYGFCGPRSYTGEDLIEIHLPGSPALIQMMLEHLQSSGAVAAAPGEFTQRAFLNGRMDLVAAEAVAALISAQTDAEIRAAHQLLDGQLKQTCSAVQESIVQNLALVEASVDFVDEDITFMDRDQLLSDLGNARTEMEQLLKESLDWETLKSTPCVALAGAPNVGKSSLLNRLCGLERTIVSSIAGTTRDVIRAPMQTSLGEVLICDCAGFEVPQTPLEHQMKEAADTVYRTADHILFVIAADDDDLSDDVKMHSSLPARPTTVVQNKSDLVASAVPQALEPALRVSAMSGAGIDALEAYLAEHLLQGTSPASDQRLALGARHRQALADAAAALERAIDVIDQLDLLALELREALYHTGTIAGSVVNEQILDRIFSQFCIGK